MGHRSGFLHGAPLKLQFGPAAIERGKSAHSAAHSLVNSTSAPLLHPCTAGVRLLPAIKNRYIAPAFNKETTMDDTVGRNLKTSEDDMVSWLTQYGADLAGA